MSRNRDSRPAQNPARTAAGSPAFSHNGGNPFLRARNFPAKCRNTRCTRPALFRRDTAERSSIPGNGNTWYQCCPSPPFHKCRRSWCRIDNIHCKFANPARGRYCRRIFPCRNDIHLLPRILYSGRRIRRRTSPSSSLADNLHNRNNPVRPACISDLYRNNRDNRRHRFRAGIRRYGI